MLSLLKGIIISIALGVPAGPVGVMTIQNSLKSGFKSGFMTGMGSVVADLIFASVGAFGVHIISDFMKAYQDVIAIVGGIILIILGIRSIMKKPKPLQVNAEDVFISKENMKGFTAAFVISITNPATIMAFLVAFSTFNVAENLTLFEASMLVLGVVVGAVLWWLILAGGTSKFKEKIKDKTNKALNVGCGVIMIILAVVMFVKTII